MTLSTSTSPPCTLTTTTLASCRGNQLIKECGEIIRASFQEGLTLRYVDDSILTITAPSPLKKLLP